MQNNKHLNHCEFEFCAVSRFDKINKVVAAAAALKHEFKRRKKCP
jgi:hypothetical protein